MAVKQIAHGTIFKTNAAGSGLANVTLVSAITPPPRIRQEIEGVDLTDTLEVPLLGIEQKSEVIVNQFWDPGDAGHHALDGDFDAKTNLSVQLVTPHAVPVIDEFTAKISKLEPEELTPAGTYKRKVTMIRTSAITRTEGSDSSSIS